MTGQIGRKSCKSKNLSKKIHFIFFLQVQRMTVKDDVVRFLVYAIRAFAELAFNFVALCGLAVVLVAIIQYIPPLRNLAIRVEIKIRQLIADPNAP